MKPTEYFQTIGRACCYYPALSSVTGGLTRGVLLSQLLYWDEQMGHKTFYKTLSELALETGLSLDEIKGAKSALVAQGFLSVKHARLEHRLYWSLSLETINLAIEKAFPKVEFPLSRNAVPHFPESGNSTLGKVELPLSFLRQEITPGITTKEPGTPIVPKGDVSIKKPNGTSLSSEQSETISSIMGEINRVASVKRSIPSPELCRAVKDGLTTDDAKALLAYCWNARWSGWPDQRKRDYIGTTLFRPTMWRQWLEMAYELQKKSLEPSLFDGLLPEVQALKVWSKIVEWARSKYDTEGATGPWVILSQYEGVGAASEEREDSWPGWHAITEERWRRLCFYWNLYPDEDFWGMAFLNANCSDFVRSFIKDSKIGLDFFLRRSQTDNVENVVKVYEGRYENVF